MKKQFRLYDVYRYAAVGEMSSIIGVKLYEVDKDSFHIRIVFTDGYEINRFCRTEDDRKAVVKEVNKILRNCRKPGRKSRC